MPKSTASTTSYSAISVVSAIGTGYGATIGINVPCRVDATFTPRAGTDLVVTKSILDKHDLIPRCVEYVEKFLNRKIPKDKTLNIEIRSEIPVAVGLKSSSAISTAVVSAAAKLLLANENNAAIESREVIELSCRASKRSKASITGAFDDAVGSLLGGLALTENRNFRVIKHAPVPRGLGTIAVVRFPHGHKVYTCTVKTGSYSKFRRNSMDAFRLAREGKILGAMMLNSLVQCSALNYSFDPINSALLEGATCAGLSGKGPSIAALCTTNKIARRIERKWREEDEELKTGLEFIRTTVRQPKEILR